MKQKIVFFIISFFLLFSNVIYAASVPHLIFDDESYVDSLSGYNTVESIYYEDGKVKLTFIKDGSDPYVYLPLSLIGDIPCDKYKVLAIGMNAPVYGKGNIYFATDVNNDLNEDKNVSTSEYTTNGKIGIVIADLGSNPNYEGYVSQIRFDPYSAGVEGVLEIKWFAFFESVDAAYAFNGDFENVSTPTPYSTIVEKTYVPQSTLLIKNDETVNTTHVAILFIVFGLSIVSAAVISIKYLIHKNT